jgi:aminopeptidase-like protein
MPQAYATANASEMYLLAEKLWPINRSVTGQGVNETFDLVKELLPSLVIKSVPSGTQAFDWKVPLEWNVQDAFILTPEGQKICDFKINNLSLVGYSVPVDMEIDFLDLTAHLHYIDEQPNAIPYVTSYYKEDWGFCLTKNEFMKLKKGTYRVYINSTLQSGKMNYGELLIQGRSKKEILISTYICHPSMANNEISGPVVTTYLAKWLEGRDKYYSYRIIFVPETIGSIYYLSRNYRAMKRRVVAGFNVTCVGDERKYSLLASRKGNSEVDEIARHVLRFTDKNFCEYPWTSRGSDERQYCAPGIDLPVASIMRSKYGEYPEYHTSLDKLGTVVTAKGLSGGFLAIARSITSLEANVFYQSCLLGEPHMSRRNAYPTLSIKGAHSKELRRRMDVLSLCDGNTSLLEIANKISVPIWELSEDIAELMKMGLIKEVRDFSKWLNRAFGVINGFR